MPTTWSIPAFMPPMNTGPQFNYPPQVCMGSGNSTVAGLKQSLSICHDNHQKLIRIALRMHTNTTSCAAAFEATSTEAVKRLSRTKELIACFDQDVTSVDEVRISMEDALQVMQDQSLQAEIRSQVEHLRYTIPSIDHLKVDSNRISHDQQTN